MSNIIQKTKAFNGVVGTEFAPLNDLDNRFLIKISDRLDDELRDELARYATVVNEGNEHSAAVTKTREGGPYATIVKDTASGREFAFIAYRSLDKNYPDTMPPADPYISTNYTVGELVGRKVVGTPAEAMAKMGLKEDMGFPVDKKTAVPGSEQWWLTQGVQNMIKEHQKENRLALGADSAKVDQRSIMNNQSQFERGLDEYLDEKERLIESIVKEMVHHRNLSVDSKITQDERFEHEKLIWNKIDNLQEENAKVLDVIISPEKFVLDQDDRIVPADGVDLANRYAQTTDDKMTALGDINKAVRVGRVSDEALQASTVINEGDTVLSAIRVKQYGNEDETNLYAIKAEDGQSWIRAERLNQGETIAINGMALSLIDIHNKKLKHGGHTSEEDVVKQILPESLRQMITSKQIMAHKEWLASDSADDKVKYYLPHDYINAIKNSSSSPDDIFYASRELLAERIDNRFSVVDLDKKQIALIDRFTLISGSKKNTYSNQEHRGISSGFIVTDHSDNTRHVIGQHLIERSDEKDPTIKTIQAEPFDLTLKENEAKMRISPNGYPKGNILVDINPEKVNHLMQKNSSYLKTVKSEYDGQSYEAKDSIKWDGVHILATIANSPDIKNSYDPKIDNNFGMEGKHPALVKIQSSFDEPARNVESEKTHETAKMPRRAHP
ncbi:hypothetical protein [uncultured Psychrobacter sp.]|uniref:hypothetical protein n=1 Tax=uncultured Psychrobacter sp. TaxID=259303 RepID=UPI0030D77CD4